LRKRLIVQFSYLSLTCSLFSTNILINTLFLNVINICSISLRDRVSQADKRAEERKKVKINTQKLSL
jgi:hypothetical protein